MTATYIGSDTVTGCSYTTLSDSTLAALPGMKPPVGSRGGWCGAVPTQGTWSAADRGQAAQQFDNMFHLIYVRLYRDGVLFDSTTVQDQTVWADHRGGRASGTLNCDGTHGIPLPGTFSLQGV